MSKDTVETGANIGGEPLARSRSTARRARIALVADGLSDVPEEARRGFAQQLAGALAEAVPDRSGFRAIEWNHRSRFRWVFRGPRVLAALAASPPASVVYIYPVTLMGLLRLRLMKLVTRGSAVLVALHPVREGFLLSRLARRLAPDLLVVTTRKEQVHWQSLGLHVLRIEPAVDGNRFRPTHSAEERAAIRERWGLDPSHDLVVHVGHLKRGRNLAALKQLTCRPRTQVVVVASGLHGSESERLRAELEAAGIRVYAGFRADIDDLYRAADCYVFPVRSTGDAVAVPFSVLEALASGLPVVTTRFGGLAERFDSSPAVRFIDTDSELIAAVDQQLTARPDGRAAVAELTWATTVENLISEIDRL